MGLYTMCAWILRFNLQGPAGLGTGKAQDDAAL
jgi:hypothetical protein